jgi:hypothetical protein
MWNGQEEAFRMFTIVGVVFLVWCNVSQLPISRQTGSCVLVGDKSRFHSLTPGRTDNE